MLLFLLLLLQERSLTLPRSARSPSVLPTVASTPRVLPTRQSVLFSTAPLVFQSPTRTHRSQTLSPPPVLMISLPISTARLVRPVGRVNVLLFFCDNVLYIYLLHTINMYFIILYVGLLCIN